jgi:hypothetical protein
MSNSAGIESYEHKLKSGSHGGKHEDGDFQDIAMYSLIEVNQRFRGAHSLHHKGDE